MAEELINLVVGKYRIELYKHKIVKHGTFRTTKPYELTLLINMSFSGERPDFRTTFHEYFSKKKEALDIIKGLPIKCKL